MSHPITHASLIASQQAALDKSRALLNLGLQGTEKVFNLHLETTRQSTQALFEHARQLLASSTPGEASKHLGEFVRPQLEHLAAYFHQLWSLSLATQNSLVQLAEESQAETNRSLSSVVDWYASTGNGAESSVSAIRSAISATNSAFDQATRLARQVSDIADAGVNAAANAGLRAAGASTRKKAA